MIKARVNGENIVLPTDLEEWRNEGISEISDGMLYLVRKYEEIANKNTEESEIIGRRYKFLSIPSSHHHRRLLSKYKKD